MDTSQKLPIGRILLASLVGSSVEFYDFYIYATATSLVFGALFFPAASSSAQLLSSYATLSLAFIARPVGGIIFGHFGDRIGRKSTLVGSLLLMGISTAAIGLLPTYAAVGWVAPALLCLLRLTQGVGLGGEWSGAALLAVENAPRGWRGRYGSVPQLGSSAGFLAANLSFLAIGAWLSPEQFREWGWRIPFLASTVLIAVGLWARLRLSETAAFTAALRQAPPAAMPLVEVLRGNGGRVFAGILGVICCFALYYVTTAFVLGYGTSRLHYPRQALLEAQIVSVFLMIAGVLLAGWLSDRFGARRVLIGGCLGAIVSGALLTPLVGSGSIGAVLGFLAFSMFTMGFLYGPLGAWLPSLFPAHVRYTGTSLAFNVGSVIGGGFTPFIAASVAERGGLTAVGVYASICALLSIGGLLLTVPGRLGVGVSA